MEYCLIMHNTKGKGKGKELEISDIDIKAKVFLTRNAEGILKYLHVEGEKVE